MWMMCEGWPQHRGLRPLLFSNSGVGSFTSHKNQKPSLIFGCPKLGGVGWEDSRHFFPGHVSLHLNLIYSRTHSIRSPMGPKNLAVSTGWPHYWGRVKFHDFIRGVMKSTPYITFAPLEQFSSLVNNQNVDTAHSYCKNYFKLSFSFLRNWLLHHQKQI